MHAQRAGTTFRGVSSARQPVHSASVGPHGSSNRLLGSHSHRNPNNFGSFFFPYGEPFGNEQTDVRDDDESAPLPAILQSQGPSSEPRAHKPLVIEVPGAADSTPAKIAPLAIFILANGERLEARRFVLTASNLSINIERQQRILPIAMLDINATVNANRDRGIDLRVPYDRDEISLSF